MAVDSVTERTRKANAEAKVLLTVILGFTAVVVLFMVFMMANAPRGSVVCDESQRAAQYQLPTQSQQAGIIINALLPLHPSFPGSEDCVEPSAFPTT